MGGAGGGSSDIDWGAIGASLGSAALGAGGSLMAGRQARKTAERLYKNRYQWSVADLRAAGLNPMLAYGGVGGPNQPFTPNILEGPAAELGQLPERLQRIAKSRSETTLASAQEAAARQAAATGAAVLEREQSQTSLNRKQEELTAATAALRASEIESQKALAEMYRANAGRAVADTTSITLDQAKKRVTSDVYEDIYKGWTFFKNMWRHSAGEVIDEEYERRQRQKRP